MKENTKKQEIIYGAIAVSLMALFTAPGLWNYYQEKQQEAQAKETCRQLQAFREDVLKRAKAGIKLESGEALAALNAGAFCPDSR